MAETAADIEIFNAPEPAIRECETPPDITELRASDRLVLASDFANDFRVRRVIAYKLENVLDALPRNRTLIIYEAFRPRTRQWQLWNRTWARFSTTYPDMAHKDLHALCATLVADPGKAAGSGHQSAAAIDTALGDAHGQMLDFGTAMQSFTAQTATCASDISPEARHNRNMLLDIMHAQGLINYPAEWWHFSYGDRLWAQVTGHETAFFGPVDA